MEAKEAIVPNNLISILHFTQLTQQGGRFLQAETKSGYFPINKNNNKTCKRLQPEDTKIESNKKTTSTMMFCLCGK